METALASDGNRPKVIKPGYTGLLRGLHEMRTGYTERCEL